MGTKYDQILNIFGQMIAAKIQRNILKNLYTYYTAYVKARIL